jgi:hypothetical protein
MGKFFAAIGGVLAAIAAAIAIYQFVKPSGPPAFSASIGHYAGAASFISFLSQHDTDSVNLNVTCIEPASQSACNATSGPGADGIELELYSSQAAAACWNSNSSTTCSGGALITFVPAAGASGTLSSPGAGYYILKGDWRVQDLGSGGSSPEGDESYQLTAIS